jgi:(5-formylfuran-3-yl)methyl phosphate synthase
VPAIARVGLGGFGGLAACWAEQRYRQGCEGQLFERSRLQSFRPSARPVSRLHRGTAHESIMPNGRLLVSVRGPTEAVEAARGGAHIADAEYPGSALGTPYPLNIKTIRDALDEAGFNHVPISTNIGEKQANRSTACQAALGVAVAGADYVKCGLADFEPKGAAYLGRNLVRTVRAWRPHAKVYPVVFPEEEFVELFGPFTDGPALVQEIDCDGLLIDTFHKNIGMGLLDYYSIAQIQEFVKALHALRKEAWIAGSITKEEMPALWRTGVDVICVRSAACNKSAAGARFGDVTAANVAELLDR